MKTLNIERIFSAPMEKVWEAFTTAEQLKKWWSPPEMEVANISVDLKKDGLFRYCFKGTDGKEYWGRGRYQTIDKPTYLSYLDTFTDAEGKPVPPSYFGMPGGEILETLVEFSLSEEDGQTKMKMVGENPFDEAMTADMRKGWEGMFDKLEEFLK